MKVLIESTRADGSACDSTASRSCRAVNTVFLQEVEIGEEKEPQRQDDESEEPQRSRAQSRVDADGVGRATPLHNVDLALFC